MYMNETPETGRVSGDTVVSWVLSLHIYYYYYILRDWQNAREIFRSQ